MSNVKRCLTWFIYSHGYGFKMEIPFDSITRTSIANATPGQALASFYLSCPPLFYLESMSSLSAAQPPTKIWKICQDWTEGQQASKVLRHDLVGAAVPLLAALKSIPEFPSHGSALLHSSFHSPDTPLPPPMHIPQPPLAGLEPPPPPPFSLAAVHSHLVHGRKRSFSGPPILTNSNPVTNFSLPGSQTGTSAPSSSNTSFPGSFPDRTSLMFNPDYSAPLFRPFPAVQPPSASLSQSDFSTVPISHSASRSFSATAPGEARFPFDSLTGSDQDRFSPSDTRMNQPFSSSSSSSSSPLLLTSPFDPSTLRHHDVQGSSMDMDMDTSGFSNHPGDHPQAANSFPATLDMPSSASS